MKIEYVSFGLILDNIHFPDGKEIPSVLGGGGPQVAFGMRLWSKHVGFVAQAGSDLPVEILSWFDKSGIDHQGLQIGNQPTLRAVQNLDIDGNRTQTWISDPAVRQEYLSLTMNRIPQIYQQAKIYHLGLHPDDWENSLDFIHYLKGLGALVSIELYKPADKPLSNRRLQALLRSADLFSLNQLEAYSLIGKKTNQELIQTFKDNGGKLISLRLGSQGSFVANGTTGQEFHIPIYPVMVVDPTGAGNAFCGGFAVGWGETKDLLKAGLYGSVASSIIIEQIGVPMITPEVIQIAEKRLNQLDLYSN
ncbi:MAG TPA: PfkB family carbohydrate kinase [Anaerolineaceae bacterium]|nr:PfkB family carbohydrate kinase [Anaerolineaceae bacterium]